MKILWFFILLKFGERCDAKRIVYSIAENQHVKIFNVDNENDIPDNYTAKAIFDDKINSTGWSFLELQTSNMYSDEHQAYAAGFIEGILTQELIWMYWKNIMADLCNGREKECDEIRLFIDKNMQWLQNMIDSQANVDPYWYQVKLYLRQFDGLVDGYNKEVKNLKQFLSKDQLMLLNLEGDLSDLILMNESKQSPVLGRCSALIKIIPDGSDIYASQVTWTIYQSMLRIQKKYILNYETLPNSNEKLKGHTMSFSSYPAVLQSGDDFYVISSGIISLETTITNYNNDLWGYVKPTGQIMEFIRAMVANRLANSGEEWGNVFKKYNSGTYNNQWMILDYKKFKPTIKPGLLWVLEQMPGTIEMQDMTSILQGQTYWPSYNLPYFPKIYNISGYLDMTARLGDAFDYHKHPRGRIFKRDHVKINNMDDMLTLMRYNNFKHDPLSRCDCEPPYDASYAISARNDLNLLNGTYQTPESNITNYGATDAKIVNMKLSQTYQFLSVSGPAFNISQGIPPFKWSGVDLGETIPHIGHPDLWQFEPITYNWTWTEN